MPQTYRIHHFYDRFDQSVYLAADFDPSRAAVYCQFLAEEHLGESAIVLNRGIAKALIELYGCTPAAKVENAISLDLHFAREGMCKEYKQLMADTSLHREGIVDMIKPFTEI